MKEVRTQGELVIVM